MSVSAAGVSNAILVDDRAGSHNAADPTRDLARYIVPHAAVRNARGLPTDVVFTGWGPGGVGDERVEIGIEYKTLSDVLSCIGTGRFSGNQLPDLCEYDYAFLLIEGIFRRSCEERGERIELLGSPLGRPRGWYDTAECGWGKRIWHMVELENWLTTVRLCTRGAHCGGVVVLPYTAGKFDSGRAISNLWRWFNDKRWSEHRSHLVASKAHLAPLRGELSLLLRAGSEIAGLGTEAVLSAEREFGSLYEAVTGCLPGSESAEQRAASEERWAELAVGGRKRSKATGRMAKSHRFGHKRAAAVVSEIRGER